MMEQRVSDSEDKLQEVMSFIKESDLEYVSSFIDCLFDIFILFGRNLNS